MKVKTYSFGWWLIFILLAIWQLPQVIIALVMMPFLGKLTLVAVDHYAFCFHATKMRGGISLGSFCFVGDTCVIPEIIAHELDGHTVDSKRTGWLYLLIIGIPSFLWATFYSPKKHSYYDFYTERWANNHAGLEAVGKHLLIFKNETK